MVREGLFHYVLCAAGCLEEGDLGGGLLVEERVGEHFHDTKLSHGSLHVDELLAAIIDAYLGAGRHVVIDAVLHLGTLFGSFFRGNGRGDGLQDLDGGCHGFASQVVGIQHAELLREAEQDVAVAFLLRVVEEGEDLCVGLCGAAEERLQDCGLLVELVEHELELCAILGRVVGLATDEGVLAVAYVVDFLCAEFRHLRGAAGSQYLLRHVATWILGCRSLFGLGQVGQEGLLCIAIDAQQDTVAAKSDKRCHGFALYFDAVCFVLVWLAERFQRDALEVPPDALLRGNVLQAQVAVGVLVEVAGTGGCLLCNDCDAESSTWQVVGNAFECAAWHKGFNLRLCGCTYCYKKGNE